MRPCSKWPLTNGILRNSMMPIIIPKIQPLPKTNRKQMVSRPMGSMELVYLNQPQFLQPWAFSERSGNINILDHGIGRQNNSISMKQWILAVPYYYILPLNFGGYLYYYHITILQFILLKSSVCEKWFNVIFYKNLKLSPSKYILIF